MHQLKLFNLPEAQCSLQCNECILSTSVSHTFYALAHIFLAYPLFFSAAIAVATPCAQECLMTLHLSSSLKNPAITSRNLDPVTQAAILTKEIWLSQLRERSVIGIWQIEVKLLTSYNTQDGPPQVKNYPA